VVDDYEIGSYYHPPGDTVLTSEPVQSEFTV
jgi:hypothetical protein